MRDLDWRPTATLAMLQARARLLARIRTFFDSIDFWEVQTPILSHDTMVDRYIDPIAVDVPLGGQNHRLWLQTSPEFAMKRLLAAGAQAIYQIGPVFRGGEWGIHHNPEFTMLEWYRTGDDYERGRGLLADFCQALLPDRPVEQLSYRDAFLRTTAVDPETATVLELRSRLGSSAPPDRASRSDLLNQLFSDQVAPQLGQQAAQIVFDWPVEQSALAVVRKGDFPVAERFELFVSGLELANGYHELTDPNEFRRRIETANRQRVAANQVGLPISSRLQAALEAGMPAGCGVAVGVDRLLMVLTGATSLAEVLVFPFDSA